MTVAVLLSQLQVDVTGAIPEQWNADELRRKFERSVQDE